YKKIRDDYVSELINEIRALDTNSFRVRKRIEVVSKFKKREAWTNLNNQDILQLEDEVAPIIIPPKDHEMIQRFDLSVLSLALAILEGGISKSLIRLIRETCNDIMKHGNIPAVFDEKYFIIDVAGEDFWKDIDFLKLEDMRLRIRNLVP